jgi:hypothetical protein
MTLSDLLSAHIANIPASLQAGDILKIAHAKNFTVIHVTVSFPELVDEKTLTDFEQAAAEAANAESFRIFPRYSPALWESAGKTAAFAAIDELRKTLPAVNGHFDEAVCTIINNSVTFEIKKPAAFLEMNKFCERYAETVRTLFSVSITVSVKGTENAGEFEKKREEIKNAIPASYSEPPPPPPPLMVGTRDVVPVAVNFVWSGRAYKTALRCKSIRAQLRWCASN